MSSKPPPRHENLDPTVSPSSVETARAAPARAPEIEAEIDRFAAELRGSDYTEGTIKKYRSAARALVVFLSRKGRAVEDITAQDWKAYRRQVLGPGVSRTKSYAEHLLMGARTYLRFKSKEVRISFEVFAPERELRSSPPLPQPLSSLLALLEQAMQTQDLSATTRPCYRRAWEQFLHYVAEQEGIGDLLEVNREVLTAYRLYLQTETSSKGAPYSVSTQRGVLNGLRFFFRWLVKTGTLLVDPTLHLKHPRAARTVPRTLKVSEITAVLRSLPLTPIGLRDRAMLELLYGTGMRRSEVARLRLEDMDLEQGTALIREGKGRKDRLVPLGKKAREAVLDYLELSRGKLCRQDTERLLVGRNGDSLSLNYISDRLKRLGERVGVKLWPHLLRHSCATHLLRGRADIRHIQRLLGHRSLQSTEWYTRVEVSDLREVIRRCHPREKR